MERIGRHSNNLSPDAPVQRCEKSSGAKIGSPQNIKGAEIGRRQGSSPKTHDRNSSRPGLISLMAYSIAELHLHHWPVRIAHFDRHIMGSAIWLTTYGIARHVGKRTRGLFLHPLQGRQFQTLFVRSELVAFAEVKIVTRHGIMTSEIRNVSCDGLMQPML
jgi:hypothetical protein